MVARGDGAVLEHIESCHVLGVVFGLVSGHLLKLARNACPADVTFGEAVGLSFCVVRMKEDPKRLKDSALKLAVLM
jgi:hypothetical protein